MEANNKQTDIKVYYTRRRTACKMEIGIFKGQICLNHHWRCPFADDEEQTKPPTDGVNRRRESYNKTWCLVKQFSFIHFISSSTPVYAFAQIREKTVRKLEFRAAQT